VLTLLCHLDVVFFPVRFAWMLQKTRPDDPEDSHYGWTFASPDDPPFASPTGHGQFSAADCIPDTVNGARTIREVGLVAVAHAHVWRV
jgi:hypothetical protein